MQLTLSGSIPGLLRKCSPVIDMLAGVGEPRVGVVILVRSDAIADPDPVDPNDIGSFWVCDEKDERWEAPGECGLMPGTCLGLDLTDRTGVGHAGWWLNDHGYSMSASQRVLEGGGHGPMSFRVHGPDAPDVSDCTSWAEVMHKAVLHVAGRSE